MNTKIYALTDENNQIRYIGKTSKTLEKRLQGHFHEANHRNKNYRCNWIRSLFKRNTVPKIILLGEVNGDGNQEEIAWITYGKEENWELTNGSSGGEGLLNPSPKTREKMSKWQIGKELSEETKIKISNSLKGKPNSRKGKHLTEAIRKKISEVMKGKLPWNTGQHLCKEIREKISNSNKGKYIPEETRIKISNALKGRISPRKGKHLSDEIRKKMSRGHLGQRAWNKGLHQSDDVRNKISQALKGRIFSEETKTKMRIAALARCSKIVVCLMFFLLVKNTNADSISLYEENDFLEKDAFGSVTDGFYTQGFQCRYENDNNWGIKLGQQIYTPSNKDDPNPQFGDRPYCGWLHGEYFKKIYRDNCEQVFEIGIGIVGPASGAEWVQTEFHKLIKSNIPLGWDYQIYTEPTIQFAYYRTYSFFFGRYVELRPHVGANLGNYLLNAELGATVRAGWNIPKNFGPVVRSVARGGFWNNIYAYGFVGSKGYGVARNMSLDGNTFKESIVTVDKEYVVGDGLIGICIGIYNFEITATHIERTHEFQTQTRDSRFDSFQIRWQF